MLGYSIFSNGGGASEPYVEYTISGGAVTAAKLYGFTEIPDYFFYNDSESFMLIDFSQSPSIVTIGQNAFYGCEAESFSSAPFSGVLSIGDAAFSFCTSATFNGAAFSSVSTVGEYAFYSCVNEGFTSLTLGSVGHAVTSIGTGAFYSDTQITAMTIYTTGGVALSGDPWGATSAVITYLSA